MRSATDPANAPHTKPRTGLDVLVRSETFTNLVPGVHTIGGQGNSLAIETARGVIVVDAGPGGGVTRAMIARLRELTAAPVFAIAYSHGHVGYNAGAPLWIEHAASRGEARPLLIAQSGVPARYRRYLETAPLQAWLNGRQFRKAMRPAGPEAFPMPDQTFDTRLVIDGGDRRVELLSAASETDDAIAVWLPETRFLYGGPAIIRSIPNVGTPLRTLRDPIRWANTLERLHALQPLVVLPEFGKPITAPQDVDDTFQIPIRAMRYLRDAVVARMNAGMSEAEILHDMEYPEALFGHKYMRPIYGDPPYIVREIWRTENGWWDRNPSHLHPAQPAKAAAAVLAALADPGAVLTEARRLQAAGEYQLALHVIDLLALAGPVCETTRAAVALKAALCRQRATQLTSIVSRQILLSSAEDLLGLPIGSTASEDPPANFSWN
jgi:alkyl sulfatase BDS1-like metallo-beta-lactamase superfamily hydrolase